MEQICCSSPSDDESQFHSEGDVVAMCIKLPISRHWWAPKKGKYSNCTFSSSHCPVFYFLKKPSLSINCSNPTELRTSSTLWSGCEETMVSLPFPCAQCCSFAHALNQHAFLSTLNRSASIAVTLLLSCPHFPACVLSDVSHWHHPSIEHRGAH